MFVDEFSNPLCCIVYISITSCKLTLYFLVCIQVEYWAEKMKNQEMWWWRAYKLVESPHICLDMRQITQCKLYSDESFIDSTMAFYMTQIEISKAWIPILNQCQINAIEDDQPTSPFAV